MTASKRRQSSVAAAFAALAIMVVTGQAAAAPDDLRIYFKLDERLTQPLHLGERLVSPDTFDTTVQSGKQLEVVAEVRYRGRVVPASFIPRNRSVISIRPDTRLNRVLITATRCDADSFVTVSSQGVSRSISIKTFCGDGAIRGEITQ